MITLGTESSWPGSMQRQSDGSGGCRRPVGLPLVLSCPGCSWFSSSKVMALESSLELVWDGKFADNTSVCCTTGVILKHVSHWIEPQCPCSDELDGDPFTGFLPFPDPIFRPVFPGIIFQIRHTTALSSQRLLWGSATSVLSLPKSYSLAASFYAPRPSLTFSGHSSPFLSAVISHLTFGNILSLQRLNIIEHWWSQGG